MTAMVVLRYLDLNQSYAMAIEFEMKQQDCIFNSISKHTNFDLMSHEVTGILPVTYCAPGTSLGTWN